MLALVAGACRAVFLFGAALAGWLLLGPKFKVLGAVVVANTVLVMYVLARKERTPKRLFHDEAVLQNLGSLTLRSEGSAWGADNNVPVLIALPILLACSLPANL